MRAKSSSVEPWNLPMQVALNPDLIGRTQIFSVFYLYLRKSASVSAFRIEARKSYNVSLTNPSNCHPHVGIVDRATAHTASRPDPILSPKSLAPVRLRG
jgi:hypothetical protein